MLGHSRCLGARRSGTHRHGRLLSSPGPWVLLYPESPLPLGHVLPDRPLKNIHQRFFYKSENSMEEALTLECTVIRQTSCGCTPLEKSVQIFHCFVYTRYLICKGTKTRLEPILERCSSRSGHPHKDEQLSKQADRGQILSVLT